MVATAGSAEKAKPAAGHKVSKPLMEKKRRARINQCLDELKCLLESYYSSSVRKRKLEKADILELTVKHLRSLQKTQSCAAASSSELPDFQLGFHSCLTNVHQYLLMADHLSGGDRWALAQISHRLWRCRRRGEACSTMDSGPERADAHSQSREDVQNGAGEEQTVPSDAHRLHTALTAAGPQRGDARQSSDTKLAQNSQSSDTKLAQNSQSSDTKLAQNSQSSDTKLAQNSRETSAHRNSECSKAELSVWRPW